MLEGHCELGLPDAADVEYFTRAQAGGWGAMLRAFARFVPAPQGWRVLDVGTGPGLLPRLALTGGARLAVGLDDSLPMLHRAAAPWAESSLDPGPIPPVRQDPLVPAWVLADGLRLPFADGAFDAVLATNLLFLLPDPAEGLAALAHVTRPGGTVAFVNPSDAMDRAAAEAYADGRALSGFDRFSFLHYGRLAETHHRLSAAQWAALAGATGLDDLHCETRAGGLVVFVRGARRSSS